MITGRPPGQQDFLTEGKVVRRFRRPDVAGTLACPHCGKTFHEHGWIDALEDGHIVCPGDWIVEIDNGEYLPAKPALFYALLDKLSEGGG